MAQYMIPCIQRTVIKNLFHVSDEMDELPIRMAPMHKQEGSQDCGVFAIIAVATAILCDHISRKFCQNKMREHLLSCYTEQHFSCFPLTVI